MERWKEKESYGESSLLSERDGRIEIDLCVCVCDLIFSLFGVCDFSLMIEPLKRGQKKDDALLNYLEKLI